MLTAILGGLALMAGPWFTGLDPTSHAYPAIVWALVVWIVAHLATGVLMQGYCFARSLYKKMTPIDAIAFFGSLKGVPLPEGAVQVGVTGGDAVAGVSLADLRVAHEGFFPALMGDALA